MTGTVIRPVQIRDGYPIPYITAWSSERIPTQPLTVRRGRGGEGLGFADEMSHIDRQFGALWARMPATRRGEPEHGTVHTLRQRQAMRRLLCQICGGPTLESREDERLLFLAASAGGAPIREGERTDSPPVHAACARMAIEYCPPLRHRGWATALVSSAPVWGVAGVLYHPQTLEPLDDSKVHTVECRDDQLRWVLALRLVVTLEGVTPVTDLDELADQEAEAMYACR